MMRLPMLSQMGPRHARLSQGVARLDHRRVYILPTAQGMAFLLMVLVMLLWAINYSNSTSFGLTFMVAAIMLNSLWSTHRNLLGLELTGARAEAVFVGQQAHFPVRCVAPDQRSRYGIQIRSRVGERMVHGDVSAQGNLLLPVPVPATKRGWLQPDPLCIPTSFPLGMFRAWSWVALEQRCLVYPRPEGKQPLPLSEARVEGTGGVASGAGVDDFEGLRGYVPGDSLRHIAWKAAARSDTLPVKTFHGETRKELWLDWQAVHAEGIEARLSQLCRWLLQAETEGLDYGLRLPGLSLPPASGEGHRRACLEALALFGGHPTGEPSHVA